MPARAGGVVLAIPEPRASAERGPRLGLADDGDTPRCPRGAAPARDPRCTRTADDARRCRGPGGVLHLGRDVSGFVGLEAVTTSHYEFLHQLLTSPEQLSTGRLRGAV